MQQFGKVDLARSSLGRCTGNNCSAGRAVVIARNVDVHDGEGKGNCDGFN